VIVGRPNVGKSTLFNAILGQRRAIVGDEPGITRDRIHGEATHNGRRFELIDTGGIISNDSEMIPQQILRQAKVALNQAQAIVFLIDGRAEITGADRELAAMLRRLGKPVALAVNKIDTVKSEGLAHEFHELGFEHVFPVSAEHRVGLAELLDFVTETFAAAADDVARVSNRPIKVAIIGRPNVGKSTLLNSLVGGERSIVTPLAGTTRDAVDESVTRNGVEYVFVDTAGIRRKGKTKLMAEKLSVVMARRHIRMSDVALIVLDASEGVLGLDATIAGYADEEGRAVILCVNKWDATREKSRNQFTRMVRDQLKFLEYAPIAFVSAKHDRGTGALFPLISRVWESSSHRVPTGELNRFAETLELEHETKIRYLTQAAVRPPTFVLFLERARQLHFSTERYVVNQIRKRFGFEGTPIVIKTKRR
jgi:GTP-binding protein